MMKHVIRYLIRTAEYGIHLPSGHSRPTLVGWSDADWARDLARRRSHSGYILLVAKALVIWASRVQSNTAQSTSEAAFTALSECVREITWGRSVLSNLNAPQKVPNRPVPG